MNDLLQTFTALTELMYIKFVYVRIIISPTQSYILLYLLEMPQYEILALLYVMTTAASLVAIQKHFSSSGLVTKKHIPQKVACTLNTL